MFISLLLESDSFFITVRKAHGMFALKLYVVACQTCSSNLYVRITGFLRKYTRIVLYFVQVALNKVQESGIYERRTKMKLHVFSFYTSAYN